MGLLAMPRTGELPSAADVPVVGLEPELAEGARLDRLKSARYGDGELILLLWSEITGSNRNQTRSSFTMVVDATGAVCQPKTPLSDAYAIAGGDDLVQAPDGSILWATDTSDNIELVRLVPTSE